MGVKFIDETVFQFIVQADKGDLTKMRDQLVNEISVGLLIEPKYKKELQLIESRLVGSR